MGHPRIEIIGPGFFISGPGTTIMKTGGIQMLKYFSVVCLCMMLILPGTAWPIEKDQDYKEAYKLDEIIVSATKTEERRIDVSNSVILIYKEEIEDSTAKTLGEMLGNDMGIDLRTRGDYGGASEELHIRGMGADGTQIFVNGVAINSPSLGSADVSGINLNNIEKIEVVKGAGSLLYGTGAMAGTVNIITKSPEKDITNINTSAGYGSNNTYELTAEQGMFVTSNLGYYLTAARKETDGFRSNSNLDHKDASLKLTYVRNDGPDITLYGDYVDRSYGNPGVKPPDGTEAFFYNGIKLYDSESSNLLNTAGNEDMHLNFDVKDNPVEWLKWDFKGSYTDMDSYSKNVFYYFVLSGSKTWVSNKVKGFEGNADIEFFQGMNLLIGGEYRKYEWGYRRINIDEAGLEVEGSAVSAFEGLHTYGLFSEAQYRPNNYLKLIAGVRNENHSEFGNKMVRRYGLVINPDKDTAVKFNYGQHYNAPTPNALFWPYEDWGWGSGTQGNRDLKPETGKHLDAGIEHDFLNYKVFTSITWFKWDIEDKINWISDASYFYTPQNLDRYKSQGWEIGSDIGPYYNMTLSLSYTYTNAEEELFGGVRRQALNTSDNYFKSSLAYSGEAGLKSEITYRYTGERPAYYILNTDSEPEVTLDSYSTIDLKVEQKFMNNWLVSLQCNNLLDKGYDTYIDSLGFRNQITGVTTIEGYPGAGRSVFLKVGYKY